MGGSDAHLLVGIKNTNLDPVWIKTLSSGVAVYRSVFRDIWGSNLIFAGPHKTFTNVNRVCTISHSIVESHPIARNDGRNDDLLMHEQEYCVVMNTDLGVMVASGSGTVEQCIEVESVDDMLHHYNRPLGSEMVAANMIRFGESDCRFLLRKGMQIDLSPSIAQLLMNDRLTHNHWYQLYIDNIHQFLVRSSKWEKIGRLPQTNDILLFTLTDLGYSEKAVAWRPGRVTAATIRSTSISYVSKPTSSDPSMLATIRRNPGDVSVIYAANEFYINTPEHSAQVANNV